MYLFYIYANTRADNFGSYKNQKMFMRYLTGYCLLVSMMLMTACSDSSDDTSDEGNWIQKVDFKGVARYEAVSFTINDTAFVGSGYDGEDRLKDFYSYDAERNTWTQRASLPDDAPARSHAVAFSINGKGYMGTGYDGVNKLNDFYEYDPAANAWAPKTAFPGTKRYGAVGFSVKNYGYIATGYDGNWLNDTWQYNPATDTWSSKADVPNTKRTDAVAFVIAGKAYIATGTSNLQLTKELSMYDADADQWTLKREIINSSDDDYDDDYSSIQGTNCAVFVMNNKAYVCTGSKSSSGTSSTTVWEYDAVNDLWDEKQAFEGTARTSAVGFAIKNRGFITTGASGSTPLSDTWEFDPLAEYDKND
ncbi:galactose oxidase-like protein [Chitinophaga japonensis]|uniref:Galactose oxidase-like protein n=2 Tax=Chitinophaga japonensis TaxID=104662 RepID=A0A562T5J0_CHIJA|nr:galactose oxidase-like protein [Chitinophaga japonensis]